MFTKDEAGLSTWAHVPDFQRIFEKQTGQTAERVLHSSANNQNIILLEVVLWNLEVVRSWALADTAGYVVVAAMARTEPAAIVASVGQGHAAQVSAHAHHHEPLQQDGSLVSAGKPQHCNWQVHRHESCKPRHQVPMNNRSVRVPSVPLSAYICLLQHPPLPPLAPCGYAVHNLSHLVNILQGLPPASVPAGRPSQGRAARSWASRWPWRSRPLCAF